MCLRADAGDMYDSDDLTSWQKTLDANLRSTMVGAHLAVRTMARSGTHGCIASVASAAGVYPGPMAPVYSAAKAAHLTRVSASQLTRAYACPQCAHRLWTRPS
jgi:NADP-dependent 3-hydroxy acid dehydrogenase YdfG